VDIIYGTLLEIDLGLFSTTPTQAHRETLSKAQMVTRKWFIIESPSKAEVVFLLEAKIPKTWLLPTPLAFYSSIIRKKIKERLFC
jgi:hypothetical protein